MENLKKGILYVLAIVFIAAFISIVAMASYWLGYALTPAPKTDVEVLGESESVEVEATEAVTETTTEEVEIVEETTTVKNSAYADLVVEITAARSAATTEATTLPKATTTTTTTPPTTVKQETTTVAETTTEAMTETTTAMPTTVKQETAISVTTTKAETTKAVTTTVAETEKQNGDGNVQITNDEYDYLCRLVYGESGAEPYKGQVLVAQCLYNAMVKYHCDAWTAAKKYKYTGSTRKGTSDSVKNAVAAVFYDGYRETGEFVTMFYAPKYTKGGWSSDHESQIFVCEVGSHRFFKER